MKVKNLNKILLNNAQTLAGQPNSNLPKESSNSGYIKNLI